MANCIFPHSFNQTCLKRQTIECDSHVDDDERKKVMS